MNSHIVGTLIELDISFKDLTTGNPADPTAVTGWIRDPTGVTIDISGTIVRNSIGEYKAPYTPILNGLYTYRFFGTGAVAAADEGTFAARTAFPQGVGS